MWWDHIKTRGWPDSTRGSFQAVSSSHILEATVRCPITTLDVGNYNPVSSSIQPPAHPLQSEPESNRTAQPFCLTGTMTTGCNVWIVMGGCVRSVWQRPLQTAGAGLQSYYYYLRYANSFIWWKKLKKEKVIMIWKTVGVFIWWRAAQSSEMVFFYKTTGRSLEQQQNANSSWNFPVVRNLQNLHTVCSSPPKVRLLESDCLNVQPVNGWMDGRTDAGVALPVCWNFTQIFPHIR